MSNNVFDKNVTITANNVQYMLTDEQTDIMTKLFGKLKEMSGSQRIHVAGDPDFGAFVAMYIRIVNKRLECENDPKMFIPVAIAQIDNGKSGTGKRGILVTKMGIMTLDADYPKKVEGQEQGGLIPWPLFYRFGCEEVIDDSADADVHVRYGICLMDAGELDDADTVSQEVKDGAGRELNGDPLYGAWNWGFDLVGIDPNDAVDVVKAMKSILIDAMGTDDSDEDDDDADEVEEADDIDETAEDNDEEIPSAGEDDDECEDVDELVD